MLHFRSKSKTTQTRVACTDAPWAAAAADTPFHMPARPPRTDVGIHRPKRGGASSTAAARGRGPRRGGWRAGAVDRAVARG
eukprot:2827742-Prymnesium_polylepis.2